MGSAGRYRFSYGRADTSLLSRGNATMSAEDVFQRALAKDTPEDRAAFLDQACAGNPELRAAVEALLQAATGTPGLVLQAPLGLAQTTDYRPLAEGPGTRLGPYQLLQLIGEGGM